MTRHFSPPQPTNKAHRPQSRGQSEAMQTTATVKLHLTHITAAIPLGLTRQ